MIKNLFTFYRNSPFWLRNVIARLTLPLKILMSPFNGIRVGGYYMILDYSDNASFKYYTDRERYELLEVTAFLNAIVHNPRVYVIDIGANYGAFTLAAADLCRFNIIEKIIAIEPDIKPYSSLGQSLNKNNFSSVDLRQLIVGDSPGKETLFINARSSADNRTHGVTTAPIRIQKTYEVKSTTVDVLLQELGISLISKFIIKMDIQGNEPRAIKGMGATLKSSEGFILFFEHCPYLIESAGLNLVEYVEILRSLKVDSIYEILNSEIVLLSGFSQLEERFNQLINQEENRMQGPAANFILVKNMNFPSRVVKNF
jgi:FkbM family methyltransferase